MNKIYVPCYPELSVRQLYDLLSEDDEVLSYLPDYIKRASDRTFVWTTVHVLRPDFARKAPASLRVRRWQRAAEL